MAMAMARPMIVSRMTEAIVNTNVMRVAVQNSVLCSASM